MRGRVVRITLLLFQVVWLNAVLPGHTRGIIPLACESKAQSHCSMAAAGNCPKKSSPDAPATPGRSSNCAVCQYAARMTPPPVLDWRPAALELTDLVPEIAGLGVESADSVLTYNGRAPPVA